MTAAELLERPRLFIDGQWRDTTGSSAVVFEASSEQLLGRVALAEGSDVDAAVGAARKALRGPWAAMDVQERCALLDRFAGALKSRAQETAELVSRENGMPIALSRVANGFSPAAIFRYYARLAPTQPARDVRTSKTGRRTLVQRDPVGVVAAITPWNYPQGLAAMKLAPALAAGCTVVLKPAPETALDAYAFAEAAVEAELPAGVLNIVPGGRQTGADLVAHRGVDKVAFTGSTNAGREIGAACGGLLRPVTLELGGKSAAILTDSADLGDFLQQLPAVCLPNNGQTCHASTRILAPRARYRQIVDAITDTVRALRVGDPLGEDTQIGPLVSAAHRERVLGFIEAGRQTAARITTGGSVPADRTRGFYVAPTVFADVDNSSVIARQEIFGPVLCITAYDHIDDAVALANDSDYGLAATVWTADEATGITLAQQLESGTVGVNCYELDVAAPFGGIKASGIGSELGPEGLQAYLQPKTVYLPSAAAHRS
ncbi:aldehyde dehydrogenase [Mycobacterium sp.]|uniref:aldehyde dehydrogenase n=1 Tax=Mycobacterium sp. TaxID=1785 RepID=UPI003BAEFFE9